MVKSTKQKGIQNDPIKIQKNRPASQINQESKIEARDKVSGITLRRSSLLGLWPVKWQARLRRMPRSVVSTSKAASEGQDGRTHGHLRLKLRPETGLGWKAVRKNRRRRARPPARCLPNQAATTNRTVHCRLRLQRIRSFLQRNGVVIGVDQADRPPLLRHFGLDMHCRLYLPGYLC